MTKLRELPDNLKPYQFHGLDISYKDGSKLGHSFCPFCDTEDKLAIKIRTGQFRCVKCNEHGNISSWLQKIYDNSTLDPEAPIVRDIIEHRGCSIAALDHFGVRVNCITGEAIVPQYNQKGTLCNLSKVVANYKLYSTATCNIYPFGTHSLKTSQGILWVAEGLWDGAVWFDLLNKIEDEEILRLMTKSSKGSPLFKSHGIIAIPGCNSWQDHWIHWVRKRDTRLIFDNDHPQELRSGNIIQPAYDGVKRIGISCQRQQKAKQPASLSYFTWGKTTYHDEDLKSGYDVRDSIKDNKNLKTYKKVLEHLLPVEVDLEEDFVTSFIDPLDRSSFSNLTDDFKERLHWTRSLEDGLATMLASIITVRFKGDKLWVRLFGQPGTGKSTLAECASACEDHVVPLSFQTGFHSGYHNSKTGEESSLFDKIQNKTVLIKDGDTLLRTANRDRVLAEMRDMYDGASRAIYRNRKKSIRDNIRTHFIVCGTSVLRELNDSSLGERFIDFDIFENEDSAPYIDRTFQASVDMISSNIGNPSADTEDALDMLTLKRATAGYILNLVDSLVTISPPKMTTEAETVIKDLAVYISLVRTIVKRDREELRERPEAELATRLTNQLVKYAMGLAIVFNKPVIDSHILKVLKRAAKSTVKGLKLEVLDEIGKRSNGATVSFIDDQLAIGETCIRKLLEDMKLLGLVRIAKRPNRSGQRGRDSHFWVLSDKLKIIYERTFNEL